MVLTKPRQTASTLSRGPSTPALGPLLQRRETRSTDRLSVTRFMLFEQAATYQKRDAAFAHFDRRNHSHTP